MTSQTASAGEERFANLLEAAAESPPTDPRVFYNDDGDCIEFLFSNEGFRAERVDKLVTVYYGRESGEIVGSLIKGVRRFIRNVVDEYPGFMIEVDDGRVSLKHVFTAGMWKQGDEVSVRKYKKLRDTAELSDIEIDVTLVSV